MTDTSKLVAEANAISKQSPAIKAFAQDAAANLVQDASAIGSLQADLMALKAAVAALQPPTPAPTPAPDPQPAAVLFDGRASRMTLLQSTSASQQAQSPVLWDALQFLNNDITLVKDPRYGQIYQVKVGGGSHAPGYTPTDGRASELSVRQAMKLGTWDWYSNAHKIMSPFTNTDWMLVDQYGYPSLSSPPVSIHVEGGKFSLQTWAGQFGPAPAYRPPVVNNYPIVSIPLDDWVELVVGVKWATDNTGSLRCIYRIPSKSSAWTQVVAKDGLPTQQYGTTPSGTASADYHDMPTCTDHGGLYFGYWAGAAGFPNPFPVNTVQRMGLVRTADQASAQAVFPA